MARERLLALDLGTTSVRALVFEAGGAVCGRAQAPLAARFPRPGWLEQSPDEMLEQTLAVARAALAEAGGDAGALAAVGLVTQRGSAIAWDAETGRPLAPAIGWQDRRSDAEVAALNRRGIGVNSLASATKFKWLLDHVPEVAAAARAGRLCLGTPDAWLSARLSAGACFVTDPGHASCTALYDPGRGAWSEAALGLFGLELGWLPEVVPTSAVVAQVAPGLLAGALPLAARAGDQQAATFAQGVHRPGMAKLTLGTSAMLNLHAGAEPPRPLPGFYPLPLWQLANGERAFCHEGSVITAASAIDWLVELGLLPAADQLDAVASSVHSSEGVSFVPALQGLGSPFLDADARGLVLGLTRGSSRAHLVRAVLEGVAQRCADLCEGLDLEPGPLRVDGGLARSGLLLQQLADLLGGPLLCAAETETTAQGAAGLAGLAVGLYRDPAEAVAGRAPPRLVEPARDGAWRDAERAAWRRAIARARGGG